MLQEFICSFIIVHCLLPETLMNEKFLRVSLPTGQLKIYSISSCVCLSVMRMPAAFYLQAFRDTGDWGFILQDSYHIQLLLGLVSSVTTNNSKTKSNGSTALTSRRIEISRANWDYELLLLHVHRFVLSFNFLFVLLFVEVWSV